MKRKISWALAAALAAAALLYFWPHAHQIVLTGTVTTDEIIISPEIQGRVQRLLVHEGDVVTNGQLLAVIQPQEWQAEMDFYARSQGQSAAEVTRAESDLAFQQAQTSNQILQAEASQASAEAQAAQAQADAENTALTFKREEDLYHRGVDAVQTYDQARTANAGMQARLESLRQQATAAAAAVALAKSSEEQIAARRAALSASVQQLGAAKAQTEMAQVRLGHTEIRSPANAFVNVRAALQGEVVNPGQAVVTLVDPDDLWVRADVEESYIDHVRLGDHLTVRLPSGQERDGTVFYRGLDADYATQRDVSRSKRDIKTFEIRVRCDNRDRSLALGMTAYVLFPLERR